eukprot:Lithocolla_globosa_v1_NODE_167_length_5524_cov_11.838362.p2 type:complete len:488 gc:universal NODE_167_length_5524_cov_11.838362:3897-2434(-)
MWVGTQNRCDLSVCANMEEWQAQLEHLCDPMRVRRRAEKLAKIFSNRYPGVFTKSSIYDHDFIRQLVTQPVEIEKGVEKSTIEVSRHRIIVNSKHEHLLGDTPAPKGCTLNALVRCFEAEWQQLLDALKKFGSTRWTVLSSFLDMLTASLRAGENGEEINMNQFNAYLGGSPGTGKTTAANLFATMLFLSGVTHFDRAVVFESPSSLGGNAVGDSSSLVARAFQEARGGVLMIDEASQFIRDKSEDGRMTYNGVVFNEIVGRTGLNPPFPCVVFLAGYAWAHKDVMALNSGASRRFEYIFFPPYTDDQLLSIFESYLPRKKLVLTANAKEALRVLIGQREYIDNFGEAGDIEKLVNKVELKVLGKFYSPNPAPRTFDIRTNHVTAGWNAYFCDRFIQSPGRMTDLNPTLAPAKKGSPEHYVSKFVQESLVYARGKVIRKSEIHEVYKRWCKAARRRVLGRTKFFSVAALIFVKDSSSCYVLKERSWK